MTRAQQYWLKLLLLFCVKLQKVLRGDSDMPGASWCASGLGPLYTDSTTWSATCLASVFSAAKWGERKSLT